MLRPRWRKAFRDIWSEKSRALLAVLAMGLGVFGVGAVIDAYVILIREMDRNYLQTNPASAILTLDRVDADLLRSVGSVPEVTEVQARRTVTGRILVGPDEWRPLWLFIVPDFQDIRIDRFRPEGGRWPPANGELLLERAALRMAGDASIGDNLTIRLPGAQPADFRFAGVVHAPGLPPAWMEGLVYGFATPETLAAAGYSSDLDELRIRFAGALNQQQIRTKANELADWLRARGHAVHGVEVPKPGQHPHASQMATLLFLLEAFGSLSLLLSAVMTASIISALLARQIRQIGVMKAIGARSGQIAGMYLAVVAVLGSLAVVCGIPAGFLSGRLYAGFAARMLNFEIYSYSVPLSAIALQASVGLLVPLLIALIPVWRGGRITVREAISDYGASRDSFGGGFFDRRLARLSGISRPIRMSIRNAFRRRARLVLTLGALSVGGACFIVAMNVWASIESTTEAKFDAMRFDLRIRFAREYPTSEVERALGSAPGVARAEAWGSASAARVYSDGALGNAFSLVAPPANTTLMAPLPLLEGRWWAEGDSNALVVNQALLSKEAGIRVGDALNLRLGGRESSWRVVGVVRETMGLPAAYSTREALAATSGRSTESRSAVVAAVRRDSDQVRSLARSLERRLSAQGIEVAGVSRLADQRRQVEDHLVILVRLLIIMAALVVLVGGLGLSSTMSINVLERTREIGVLRAIGASNHILMSLIMAEGATIGALSWLCAVALSWPVSRWVSYNFGMTFFEAPLEFAVSPAGMALWFGVVIVFGAAASWAPAWRASRLTARDLLVYE